MFTKFFNSLTPIHKYNLLAALRGPDDFHKLDLIKASLTGRIRVIVIQDVFKINGTFTTQKLSKSEYIEILEVLCNCRCDDEESYKIKRLYGIRVNYTLTTYHYVQHLKTAISASINHPIWNNHAKKLINVLASHSAAVKELQKINTAKKRRVTSTSKKIK